MKKIILFILLAFAVYAKHKADQTLHEMRRISHSPGVTVDQQIPKP